MAGSVSRATEQKPGGLEVILCRLSQCRSAAPVCEMDAETDRFSRPKNSSYTAAARIVLRWGNGDENGDENCGSVTTTHLFWPNQRRRAAWSIPNSLRNPPFLGAGRDSHPPGGGQPLRYGGGPRPKTAHGIFCVMGSTAVLCSFKKRGAVRLPAPLRRRRLIHFQ